MLNELYGQFVFTKYVTILPQQPALEPPPSKVAKLEEGEEGCVPSTGEVEVRDDGEAPPTAGNIVVRMRWYQRKVYRASELGSDSVARTFVVKFVLWKRNYVCM